MEALVRYKKIMVDIKILLLQKVRISCTVSSKFEQVPYYRVFDTTFFDLQWTVKRVEWQDVV